MVVSVLRMVNFAKLAKWILNATHSILRRPSAMRIWDVSFVNQFQTLGVLRMRRCATLKRAVACPVIAIRNVRSMDLLIAVRAHVWLAAMMRIVATECAPIFLARLSVPSAIQADHSRRMVAANMNRIVLALVAVVLACIMTIAQRGIRCVTSTGTHAVSARPIVSAQNRVSCVLVGNAAFATQTGRRLIRPASTWDVRSRHPTVLSAAPDVSEIIDQPLSPKAADQIRPRPSLVK